MKSKMESKHFLIIGKLICTFALLFVIFAYTLFLFVIVPLIMILVYHNQKGNVSGFKFSIAMIPVGIVGLLLWRLWSPDRSFNIPVEYHRLIPGIRHGN